MPDPHCTIFVTGWRTKQKTPINHKSARVGFIPCLYRETLGYPET
jgi:hypothetical protein